MDHTPATNDFGSAFATRGFLPRGERPRASFADALSAGGGVLVWIGVFLVALDVYIESGDGWAGALFFVALFAASVVVMFAAPARCNPVA